MHRLSRVGWHVLPALAFVALAIAWTLPLINHLSSSLPGAPGDNLDFLWNTWWMRVAVASPDVSFFRTDRLFAPFGADLSLHTHTALPSWIAATVLASASTIAAQNLIVLGSIVLNGCAAYALAWSITRDRLASTIAGLIFAGSPYVEAHLLGHVNLVGPWGIPLFVLCLQRAIDRRSRAAAAGAGLCLVVTAFVDYYYLVYACVLGAGLTISSLRTLTWTTAARRVGRGVLRATLALVALAFVLAAGIVMTGGVVTSVAGVEITATQPTNLLSAGWILLAGLALLRWRPRVRVTRPARGLVAERLRVLWPMAAVTLVGLTPLLLRVWALWARGDYAAPVPSWRNGPAGVDLATLVLGNPWHPESGPWTRDLYQRLGINAIESVGWLGLAPFILVASTILRERRDPVVARWLAVGAAFFVWALGPWLRIGGFNTGLLLPQNLFAWIPVLSNARMPGRAMAVVFLSVAVLSALAIARSPRSRRPFLGALVIVLIVADYLPSPFPLTRVDVPALYTQLRDLPPGIVCELPVGLRDGFGEVGRFDDRVAAFQMTHGHPIVGGFAARVPDSIKRGYADAPVLRSLFRLSEGKTIDDRDGAFGPAAVVEHLEGAGIRYLVLNRATAPPALVAFVETMIPYRLIATEGARSLLILE